MNIPKDWPKDCPPGKSRLPQNESVYRVVKKDPPSNKDFQSMAELGKMPTADPCLRVGVSVLKTWAGAEHHRKLFPSGKFIACAMLKVDDGRVLDTPTEKFPEHVTWWPPQGLKRESLFRVV
ncbi:MAG: hypothetical protein HQL77_18205 [Magnetococcales bacterium]|nr:hypothetical protein [Magnetococcales bacterium]